MAEKGVGKSFINKMATYLRRCNVEILGFKGDGADTRMVFQKKGLFDFSRIISGEKNIDRMIGENAPIGIDGFAVQLHHLLQEEPGPMVELLASFHRQNYGDLHGFVGNGESFRNIPALNSQYKQFREKYWNLIGTQLESALK